MLADAFNQTPKILHLITEEKNTCTFPSIMLKVIHLYTHYLLFLRKWACSKRAAKTLPFFKTPLYNAWHKSRVG